MHESVEIMGLSFARLDAVATLETIFASLERGEGGLLLTANLDILRRSTREGSALRYYEAATLTVADGMPIVWASQILGQPLPERVAGASLVPRIAAECARHGRSLYLLGGDDDDAERAGRVLVRASPSLRLLGTSSPRVACPPTATDVAQITEAFEPETPDVVLIAMGSPKQEALALALRTLFPEVWFVGVGASLAFLAGRIPRAPRVLQTLGLEWAHRLVNEPRRLARRYLVEGLPFAAELLARSALMRARGPEPASDAPPETPTQTRSVRTQLDSREETKRA